LREWSPAKLMAKLRRAGKAAPPEPEPAG